MMNTATITAGQAARAMGLDEKGMMALLSESGVQTEGGLLTGADTEALLSFLEGRQEDSRRKAQENLERLAARTAQNRQGARPSSGLRPSGITSACCRRASFRIRNRPRSSPHAGRSRILRREPCGNAAPAPSAATPSTSWRARGTTTGRRGCSCPAAVRPAEDCAVSWGA